MKTFELLTENFIFLLLYYFIKKLYLNYMFREIIWIIIWIITWHVSCNHVDLILQKLLQVFQEHLELLDVLGNVREPRYIQNKDFYETIIPNIGNNISKQ